MIRALLFDLDDTLVPQQPFLDQAWRDVALAASRYGLPRDEFEAALREAAAAGSDRGGIIDRALESLGATAPVDALLAAFRACTPRSLPAYDGVPRLLEALHQRGILLGLVTDGWPQGQRTKLAAAGLSDVFDAVVLSDELGRQHRKPSPLPFRTALGALGVPAHEAVYIGDRPDKDVVGAASAGLRCVRVRTGEYATVPDRSPPPWRTAVDMADAITALEPLLSSR